MSDGEAPTASASRLREKAAACGEPSYVWRSGQERRLQLVRAAVPQLHDAHLLEIGCGVGRYLEKLAGLCASAVGLEYDRERAVAAAARLAAPLVVNAANEHLPFAGASFDAVLSNEVIEHVADDRLSAAEMVRVLRPGGRLVLFCPNRWYPVEQHGVFWNGRYRFGNAPLVNYLPDPLRNRLAPHVRTYTSRRLRELFAGLAVREVSHRRIFGGYDNLVARFGRPAQLARGALHRAEGTPLDVVGLSHLLVLERV
jgi:SAM-dependent methyltransferase